MIISLRSRNIHYLSVENSKLKIQKKMKIQKKNEDSKKKFKLKLRLALRSAFYTFALSFLPQQLITLRI